MISENVFNFKVNNVFLIFFCRSTGLYIETSNQKIFKPVIMKLTQLSHS